MSTALPFVSVILPVRNEESSIARALGCLLAQDYPPDRMEIIVADGMSTDGTRQIVARAAAKDARICLIDNPRHIMAAGFNAGLSLSRGDVIVMMGGHSVLAPDYLKLCCSVLEHGIADCVGGPIRTVCQTAGAEAIALAMSSRFGVGGVAFRVGSPEPKYVDTVAFGAYTRRIVQQAGPLDEELVRDQDDEFNYRIRGLGGKILLVPQIRSWYTSRSSIRSLWRQYFQYGYWKVRVMQKHPRQMQWRHFVPAALVSALFFFLVSLPVRPEFGAAMLFALCAMYMLASAVAALGLDASEAVPYSYPELYLRRRKEDPSLPADMVFVPRER